MVRKRVEVWTLAAALVSGCRPDCVDCAAADDSALLPSPWTYEEPTPEPSRDLASVEALLPGALEALLAVDMREFLDTYDALLEYGERRCPDVQPVAHREGWFEDCTAASGAHYVGRVAVLHLVEEEGVHSLGDMDFFAAIIDPSGRRFQGDGNALWTDQTEDGVRRFEGWLLGTFGWEGHEGWMRDTPSVSLRVEASDDGAGARRLVLDGGVEWVGQGVTAGGVDLTADSSAACALEPEGALRLRFEDGEVYALEFDPDEACDGCGALRFGEQRLGTACLDTSAMLAWQGSPW